MELLLVLLAVGEVPLGQDVNGYLGNFTKEGIFQFLEALLSVVGICGAGRTLHGFHGLISSWTPPILAKQGHISEFCLKNIDVATISMPSLEIELFSRLDVQLVLDWRQQRRCTERLHLRPDIAHGLEVLLLVSSDLLALLQRLQVAIELLNTIFFDVLLSLKMKGLLRVAHIRLASRIWYAELLISEVVEPRRWRSLIDETSC